MADHPTLELLDQLATSDPELGDVWLDLVKHAESLADVQGGDTLTDEQVAQLPIEVQDLRRLAAAFAYYLANRDSREDPHQPFLWGRYRCWTRHPWPPELAAVDEATLAVWEDASQRSIAPTVRARLHDLLFLRRHGDVHRHIQDAVAAYVEAAPACTYDVSSARLLARALEIATSTRQGALIDLVSGVLVSSVETALRDDDTGDKPGVVLGFVGPLVRERVALDRVGPLLEEARRVYADNPWITESLIELQRALADEEGRATLDRELIQSWLDFAGQVPRGLAQMMWLQEAAQLATDRGLPDLRDEATRQLQVITPEDLDLSVIETSVPVPREEIEHVIGQALNEPTFIDAIRRFIDGPPPSGRLEHNLEQARQHREEFVFTAVMTPVRVANDGMPQFEPLTDEQREQFALAELEALALQYTGPFYAHAIARIGGHFAPDLDDLAGQLVALPAVTEGTARSVARSLLHFWQEDYEAALMIALPRIETLARQLLKMAGEPLYRVQAGERPGQYPTLGNLLGRLDEPLLDRDWRRYLETLLVLPGIGLNLRNERLHGLDDSDVASATAALVLVGCVYLASVEPPPAPPASPTRDEHDGEA